MSPLHSAVYDNLHSRFHLLMDVDDLPLSCVLNYGTPYFE